MNFSRALCAVATCVGLSAPVSAQNVASKTLISSSQASPDDIVASTNSCNPWKFQLPAAAGLTLAQRACFYEARLTRPSLALRAGMVAGFGQLRNSPQARERDMGEFGHRLSVIYARHTAQSMGELVAGYLNHEDLRPRISDQHGVWKRSRSALLSVVEAHDEEGNVRPALSPIAGALGSGLVGIALYRNRNDVETGFTRSGLVYGCYFASALAREFKPEMSTLAFRALHRKK